LLKVVKYKAMISPSIEVVASVGFSIALYLGVQRGMSLDQFIAVGMALFMAYEPVKKLGALNALLRQGGAAADRLEMIMQAEESVTNPANENIRKRGKLLGNISWENVDFSYQEEPVLKNVTLEVKQGEMIALVGPSGSGKTTMIQLLPRLFDPIHGVVRIDGFDLREWSLTDLRGQIAVVPQMPVLFQESILENIRVGRPSATDEEVEDAAKKAFADEFIDRLPEKYMTVVGERGSSLSGGQRQRIAMARAFLKDAPILILDEATSALDAESEAAIAESLRELSKGRTTFLIAHRFSTIRMAQRIAVLDQGCIVGNGTFEELEKQSGMFKKLLDAAGEAS
jgi:subfamily B ATP-binding cassette protein MsbA